VPERTRALEALFAGEPFDAADTPESVATMLARYSDIVDLFPDTLCNATLPFLIDWLLDNVALIEITAYNDDDAYTIFETMNDRGLSLTPTDMLKGYLLANISGDTAKASAGAQWKQTVRTLTDVGGKDAATDLLKAWLRAKHATDIRERKKDSVPRDWDLIGTAFHKWLREHTARLGLTTPDAFSRLVHDEICRYSRHYVTALRAAASSMAGLEAVRYNAHNDFTLQYPLMLAPVEIDDNDETARRKMGLVANYLDIYIARRMVNYKQIGYSASSYTMFNLIKEIRGLDAATLADTLTKRLHEMPQTFAGMSTYALHQMNRPQVRYILARLTAYLEAECGVPSTFADYVSGTLRKPFEIEHIWADDYSRFTTVFASTQEFADYRNRIGGLILLPRGLNQSLGAAQYAGKVDAFFGQNLIAKTLSPKCYVNNPTFLSYRDRTALPFRAYPDAFDKGAMDERQELYRHLAEQVWSPDRLKTESQSGR
jgi:hypothetical protein